MTWRLGSLANRITAIGVAGMRAVAVAGCAENGPKQNAGTVIGGIGGALAGSAFGGGNGRLVGVAAGTLLGAFLGSEIGKSLDKADMAYMERTQQAALETAPSGTASTWRNPDNGHGGTITPTQTYNSPQGQPCREYQQTVTIGGQQQQAYGTACRQADGSWKVVNK